MQSYILVERFVKENNVAADFMVQEFFHVVSTINPFYCSSQNHSLPTISEFFFLTSEYKFLLGYVRFICHFFRVSILLFFIFFIGNLLSPLGLEL